MNEFGIVPDSFLLVSLKSSIYGEKFENITEFINELENYYQYPIYVCSVPFQHLLLTLHEKIVIFSFFIMFFIMFFNIYI